MFAALLVVIGVIQVLPSWGFDCHCGKPSDAIASMRIVGGRRAVPHSFPWAVAIRKNGRMHCGGTLFTDRHVISAGHCFNWDKIKDLEVFIGLDNLNNLKGVDKRNISNAIIHEGFASSAVRDVNDIAIAVLDKPVEFKNTVIPICLPKPQQDFGDNVGTIIGWGRIGVDDSPSDVLLKATLKILTDKNCMNSKLAQHIEPMMMCAFSKGKDGCQGDSGGPLLVFDPDGKYVLAGIVSWGKGCADPLYPGVYTKVSQYVDWIHKHTADGKICKEN